MCVKKIYFMCWFFVFCFVWLLFVMVVVVCEFMVMVYNVENFVGVDGCMFLEDYWLLCYLCLYLMMKFRNIVWVCEMYDDGNGLDFILF